MKSLSYTLHKANIIREGVHWEAGEVRNMKLRRLFDKAGYTDIHLIKGEGYFYIVTSGDSEIAKAVDRYSEGTSIYMNSFNQQTPDEWFNDVDRIVKKALEENE